MAETIATTDRSGNLAANALLSTKLFIPQARHLQDILPRPRLVERLKAGLLGKLTLISAPAGFGKTTLLTEWIPHSDRAVSWVSLDEADNDLTRFLTYFIAALQRLKADFGQAILVTLQSPQLPPIESLLTAVVNEITHTLDEFALVLDDYHLIHLQAIHAAVAFLLNNLPPTMHLILTSRADPSLSLARLRARRQLTEIRAADLRFTPDEAAAFLNEMMNLKLSAADITALETRTEGWIAGLQLAALSMQGRDDRSGFIRAFTGSNRYVLDYLTDEVLDRRPRGTQDFLLQTSILDRLCGPLCDAVTVQRDGQTTLERLEQANLFLIPLDEERRWYRYHHLFAEVLRARLEQAHPDSVGELHRRASTWYEQQGLLAEAVPHALAAGAFEQVAHLIERMSLTVFTLSPMQYAFNNWLASLPVEVVRVRPKLCLIHAWLLLHQRDLEAALRCLKEAEQALQQHGMPGDDLDDTRNTQGEITATRALVNTYSSHFDPDQINVWAQEALECLRPDNAPYRGVVFGALGTASMHQGDVTRAEQAFAEAAIISQGAGNVLVIIAAIMNQTNMQRARGALGLAIATCRQTLDWVAERGAEASPLTGNLYLNLAELLLERNDLEAALHYATKGVERCRQGINLYLIAASSLILARIKQAQGHLAEAFELIRQARQWAEQHQITWILTLLPAMETQLHLAQGDLPVALSWSLDPDWDKKLLRPLPNSYVFIYAYEYGKITQAQVRLAQGRAAADQNLLREVLAQLEQQSQAGQAAKLLWLQMKAAALQALVYHALGDLASALSSLERALILAEPEGYVRLFVDEGEPMAQLLSQAVRASLMPDFTSRLLAAFPDFRLPLREASRGLEAPAIQNLVEPLSKRELEILSLMAQGLTNIEIAQQVFISAQTVKVHTRNIYGKLGVNSRQEAVSKARALGLLA